VQAKLPVVLKGEAIALPAPGQPTTHIVKPASDRFPSMTENEAYVMSLAAAVGLEVAPVEARVLRERTFLLIRRYDRSVGADGRVHRVHQEDFCQALGVPPETKYASEGGPTFKECFSLLRRVSRNPAADLLKLLEVAIFNLVVGNADAHGKNFSMLYTADGLQLAPFYDLVSTGLYPELSPKLAMPMGRCATLQEMDPAGWLRFSSEADLGLPFLRRSASELCARVAREAEGVAAALSRPHLDQDAIARHASLVIARARRVAMTIR
jgi:serine/threonine-protein kinase HipA